MATEQVMTHLVLANAVELISGTVRSLAGDDISTHLNGEIIDGDVLTDTVATALQSEFAALLK